MRELGLIAPQEVFGYFEDICKIPHGSGNLDMIADYCINFAKQHNLDYYHDKYNNVIIRKPATKGYENAQPVILQGHLDMVCEKEKGIEIDFVIDPISPYADGDFIRAKGTTLGADNGIAVAMILSLLADNELKHPPIEAFFTADEETGMDGAFGIDIAYLEGHRLLNLDSEYEGVIMCGCAGGIDAINTVPVEYEEVKMEMATVEISGLKGGHSGVEIDKGRANSNILMARLLYDICPISRIVSLQGGSRETAIAAHTKAIIAFDSEVADKIERDIYNSIEVFENEYSVTDDEMKITFSLEDENNIRALTSKSTENICRLLISMPDGVQTMSPDMHGLVQTSVNLGIMELKEGDFEFTNTIRSSIETQKKWLVDKISAIVRFAGGDTKAVGDYPGWPFNPKSELKDIILKTYKEVTGKDATVEAVHAGMECGIFFDKIKDLDCVSIGPDMWDVHTPNEHLSISSTQRTYEVLKKVLEYCK